MNDNGPRRGVKTGRDSQKESQCTTDLNMSHAQDEKLNRDFPDHATFREKSVTTGLVRQASGFPLFDSM